MLRHDKFRMANLWVPEYGIAERAEDFPRLRVYSPYRRVEDRTDHPATLIYTADSDSRVAPMHARKMVARLQAASRSARDTSSRRAMDAASLCTRMSTNRRTSGASSWPSSRCGNQPPGRVICHPIAGLTSPE